MLSLSFKHIKIFVIVFARNAKMPQQGVKNIILAKTHAFFKPTHQISIFAIIQIFKKDFRLKIGFYDFRWVMSLFGTAVGAGILFLPIKT